MPVDKSLFPRLKRLFSTDAVVRNIGGNQLKVMDIDRIQAFGQLQTNSLIDRFTRLHKAGQRMQYNPTMNYQTLRLQLYTDYEAMDTDPIISSALDIVCDECTLKNENQEVLQIRSTNENIQRILYNLFYDVLNIEFNLWAWIRNMSKYGDFYLKLNIAEKYGIYNVAPLSVYDINREEGQDPTNPSYVCFRYDPTALAGGNTSSTTKTKYENFEVAHFRLLADSNYLPYGRSYIEPARKIFKQLSLMEDAMLIHRIMRAPEKRIFYVNVGGIPPNEVDNFMQKTMNTMKKTPYVDLETGEYNLKFNLQNMIEDFYVPVRGNDQSTRIDTAKGLEFNGIEDVTYLRDKMMSALKVPKAFLGYEADLQGKSTLAAQDMRFARTIERIQRIVLSELNKIALIHLYVQGFDSADLVNFELKLTTPSIVYEQEKVALWKEKVDLAGQILDKKILSTDWIYDNIFEMSEDQFIDQRDLIAEDQKRAFRFSQIENEGNDPAVSGESFGTPHDLASLYGPQDNKPEVVPAGYDEKQPAAGRPKEKVSIFGTQKSEFGRDPIGKKGMMEPYKPEPTKVVYKGGSPLALENAELNVLKNEKLLKDLESKYKKGKKIIIKEENKEESGLLNDKNIRKDDQV
jgi:hypothetical protein